MRSIAYILINVFFLTVLTSFIGAQTGTSRITGVVRDNTGAAVPGAKITITNPQTNYSRSTASNDSGIFSFAGIPPSKYDLKVESPGFKQTVLRGIRALVDSIVESNVELEVGDIEAVVNIDRNSFDSGINRHDASIGNAFDFRQIVQLPTNLRRVNDLMTLQPGVTREGYVAGGRSDQANITLDGVDINDQQTGGRTSQFQTSQDSALRVTAESVEEFRITIANPNANQGRSSGAQISLVTKGGSNTWHGAGFYFLRPTRGSANDFFNNAVGRFEAGDQAVLDGIANVGQERVPRPSLSREVFGGTIGGPILKDRAFFFYNYEGQRQNLETTVIRGVPLAHVGNGEIRFSGTGPTCDPNGNCTLNTAQFNSIYPQLLQNPIAIAIHADAALRYPANDTSRGDGINTGGFRWNAPSNIVENTHIMRVDINLNEQQQLFLRGNYQADNDSGISYFPDTPATGHWSHPYGWALGHNWTIGKNKVNVFRWGLTRQALSDQGDSDTNLFGGIFSPRAFTRTFSRVTETHNFTNDFTWIKGDHTWQFGGNVRLVRNKRESSQNSFDSAATGTFFSNLALQTQLENNGYQLTIGRGVPYQNAAAALTARLAQYVVNFNFDVDGSVLPVGTPSSRNFATEEYDVYFQDIWRPKRNLTITYGLRYGLSRPVYERKGFQVVPTESLGDFFDRRKASAAIGVPLNDLIEFQIGGPINNAPGFYQLDTNNFQPRIAAAWSPSFKRGSWKKLFGGEGASTFRGGFAVTNDYFGQALASGFDELSTLGFSTSVRIIANDPHPQFTGFDQDIRSLPGVPAPEQRFSTPADGAFRIESSLDSTSVSPVHYTWSFSYGRSLPKGLYIESSYIGRRARNLFASRDIMALNNLVDPQSGVDWYTAAGMLADLRTANTPNAQVPAIPYFENLFPGAVGLFGAPGTTATQGVYNLISRVDGFNIADWTFIQFILDDIGVSPNMFLHPQYQALSAFGTTAYSNYHGGILSVRQRLGDDVSYGFNYTYSKSMDNSSGLQTGHSYRSPFVLNSLRPDDNYSVSDFDIRHLLVANFLCQLPFGKGGKFGKNAGGLLNAFVSGWQLAGVFRWNTGLPLNPPSDQGIWATNWNQTSNTVRTGSIPLADGGVDRDTQNIFSDPAAAFKSFRNAKPGETGDRNALRQPGFSEINLGLTKSFTMPWSENHKFQFRWEVLNVLNFQSFAGGRRTNLTWGIPQDSDLGMAGNAFGKIYDRIQGNPRSMQFGFRYEF